MLFQENAILCIFLQKHKNKMAVEQGNSFSKCGLNYVQANAK